MTPDRDGPRLPRRRRRSRPAFPFLQLIAMAAVLVAVFVLILVVRPETQPDPTETTKKTWAPGPTTVIHIAAAGDLNVTDNLLEQAETPSGYDFSPMFMEVAPVLSGADLTVLNFEGTMVGAPYGGESTSAPPELVQALTGMGVDLVQTANSASIRSGVSGLQSTIVNLHNAGLAPVGTFGDNDAYRRSGGYTMVEVQGIRIAVIGFTKGMDNLGLPENSLDCVNLLYEDYTTDYKKVNKEKISQVLANVAAQEPDLTIAMLHWGSEYKENLSDTQKSIAQQMLDGGVDVILGSHSHLLNKIEYDEAKGTLVAWGLGDFCGDAVEAGTNYSVVLDLEVTMDNETGLTSVTGWSVTPIATLRPEQSFQGGHRVVLLDSAIARYEEKYVGRVTDDVYDSLVHARKRVDQRIAGEEEE